MKNEKQNPEIKHTAVPSGKIRTFEEIKEDIEVYWRINPRYQKVQKERRSLPVADDIVLLSDSGRTVADITRDLEIYWALTYPAPDVKLDGKV